MHSLINNSNNSSDSESDLIKLRVQYVADTDPFTCLSMFPIPTRPVQYSFLLVTPLMHQMNTLIKVLNAPQRVSEPNVHFVNEEELKHFCIRHHKILLLPEPLNQNHVNSFCSFSLLSTLHTFLPLF